MKRVLLIAGILLLAQELDARSGPRAFQASVSPGMVRTENLLNVSDEMQFSASLAFRMNVFRHAGYFVGITLGPARRRTFLPGNPFDVVYRTVLLGFMETGVFAEALVGPYGFSYGAGYGVAGDGRSAAELFFHKITARRRFQGRFFLLTSVRHWVKAGGVHAAGLACGAGWSL